MKSLALFIAAVLPLHSFASSQNRPLLLAAGVSAQSYQQYINQNPQMISVVDYLAKTQGESNEKVYALADQLEQSPDQLLAEIQNTLRDQSFSEEEQHFLRDLLNKMAARNLTSSQRAAWQRLSCANENLLEQNSSVSLNTKSDICKTERTALSGLQKLFPWADAIKWEHRLVRLVQQGELVTTADTAYHFQILSNTHQTLNFYGTISQLKQQSFQPTPWVSGVCDQFSSSVDDFTLHEIGLVFFADSCVQPLKNPEQASRVKKWAQENKNWLYAGGALILGAVAYSLKDKTLVINTSGFK